MSTPEPSTGPTVREIVARIAASTRWGDDDTASAARQELRVRRLEQAVTEAVAAFPPLTADQKHRLHALLEPGRTALAADARHAGLNAQEVAERLGVPLGTLYYWRRTGTGPRAYKVGRELRYPVEEVADWLATQRRAG